MDGLAFDLFDYYHISGTTNAAANTVMGTKPVNVLGNLDVVIKGLIGEGVYIENGGIGVADIDVRSRATSRPFIAYVVSNSDGNVPVKAA